MVKREVKEHHKQVIKNLYDTIKDVGNFRKNPDKKTALISILKFHNNIFGSSYSDLNASCPGCVKTVLSNFKKLIQKWQTEEK